MSAYQQPSGYLSRLYKATGYSIAGLRAAFKYEQAFRLEVYLSFFLVPFAIWLAKTPVELSLLIGSWLFVMTIELLNSAIEAAIDRIGAEKHELSGRAKDLGSAAVMLSVCFALFIWLTITLL